ncbi:UDP-glucuronosyltransferase 3A1, partial [Armadillidium vulgare]
HSKIKIFITHGGLLGTMEAAYHGVPLIGMPIYADQQKNMLEVENEGWGRVMHWRDLEENAFRKLVSEVLNSTKVS